MQVSFDGRSIRLHTPAKLNLFLEVLDRRTDGFHEIETLMVAVGVYDTLLIDRDDGERTRLACRWAMGASSRASESLTLPAERDNLVWKSVEALRHCSGTNLGLRVRLIKRIPATAGLGGASSDAAAALVGANLIWRLGWNRRQLSELAATIGSDVPFFLGGDRSGASMAVCRGRGERIEMLDRMPRLHFVIVRPPEGLATALVYQNCQPARHPADVRTLIRSLRNGSPHEWRGLFCNRLQVAAEKLSDWIGKTQRVFDRLDCLGHQMSGSGTSYFAVCRHARQARRLLSVLRGIGYEQVFQASTAALPRHVQTSPA